MKAFPRGCDCSGGGLAPVLASMAVLAEAEVEAEAEAAEASRKAVLALLATMSALAPTAASAALAALVLMPSAMPASKAGGDTEVRTMKVDDP